MERRQGNLPRILDILLKNLTIESPGASFLDCAIRIVDGSEKGREIGRLGVDEAGSYCKAPTTIEKASRVMYSKVT